MTYDMHVLLACFVGLAFAASLLAAAGSDPATRRVRRDAERRAKSAGRKAA